MLKVELKGYKELLLQRKEAIMDQIEGVLNLIKDEDLERLGKLNEVDRYNTKLVSKMVFKGLMKLILMGQKQA